MKKKTKKITSVFIFVFLLVGLITVFPAFDNNGEITIPVRAAVVSTGKDYRYDQSAASYSPEDSANEWISSGLLNDGTHSSRCIAAGASHVDVGAVIWEFKSSFTLNIEMDLGALYDCSAKGFKFYTQDCTDGHTSAMCFVSKSISGGNSYTKNISSIKVYYADELSNGNPSYGSGTDISGNYTYYNIYHGTTSSLHTPSGTTTSTLPMGIYFYDNSARRSFRYVKLEIKGTGLSGSQNRLYISEIEVTGTDANMALAAAGTKYKFANGSETTHTSSSESERLSSFGTGVLIDEIVPTDYDHGTSSSYSRYTNVARTNLGDQGFDSNGLGVIFDLGKRRSVDRIVVKGYNHTSTWGVNHTNDLTVYIMTSNSADGPYLLVTEKNIGSVSTVGSFSDTVMTALNSRYVKVVFSNICYVALIGEIQFYNIAHLIVSDVTLDPNGGTGGTSEIMAVCGSAIGSVIVPERSGFRFDGYFDSLTGGTQYITSSGTSAGNWDKTSSVSTLYAHWTPLYDVSFAVNDPSYGSVSEISVTGVPYGTTLSSVGNVLNVNGVEVIATANESTEDYSYSFDSWTNGNATVNGNITVIANFTATQLKSTYTVNYYFIDPDGTVGSETTTKKVDVSTVIVADVEKDDKINNNELAEYEGDNYKYAGAYEGDGKETPFVSGTVRNDGTLVIGIYYERVYTYIAEAGANEVIVEAVSSAAGQDAYGNDYFNNGQQLILKLKWDGITNETSGTKRLSAGSVIAVNGIRIHPLISIPTVHTDGAYILIDLKNGLDYATGKTNTPKPIIFENGDLSISADLVWETNDTTKASNFAPLGAKTNSASVTFNAGTENEYTSEAETTIRFGAVWYLDDEVYKNTWVRPVTDEKPSLGTLIIQLRQVLRITSGNGYADYIAQKNDALSSCIYDNCYGADNIDFEGGWTVEGITKTKTEWMLESIGNYITYENGRKGEELMSFGGREIRSEALYYYVKDDAANEAQFIEYSAVMTGITGCAKDIELIAIPYIGTVKGWTQGTKPPSGYNDNVYSYKAPEASYTVNRLVSSAG